MLLADCYKSGPTQGVRVNAGIAGNLAILRSIVDLPLPSAVYVALTLNMICVTAHVMPTAPIVVMLMRRLIGLVPILLSRRMSSISRILRGCLSEQLQELSETKALARSVSTLMPRGHAPRLNRANLGSLFPLLLCRPPLRPILLRLRFLLPQSRFPIDLTVWPTLWRSPRPLKLTLPNNPPLLSPLHLAGHTRPLFLFAQIPVLAIRPLTQINAGLTPPRSLPSVLTQRP